LEKVLSIKNFYFYGLQLFSFSSFETFGQIRAKVSFFSNKKKPKESFVVLTLCFHSEKCSRKKQRALLFVAAKVNIFYRSQIKFKYYKVCSKMNEALLLIFIKFIPVINQH
jgi:hypothetical protein